MNTTQELRIAATQARPEGAGCQRTTSAPAQGEVFSLELRIEATRPNARGWMSEKYFCAGAGRSVFS